MRPCEGCCRGSHRRRRRPQKKRSRPKAAFCSTLRGQQGRQQVRDVVEAAVSEATFRQIALKMQKTRAIPLTGDPVKAVEVLANRYTLNDTERAGVLRHLIVEGDLTAYGLVNAVTHYSQEVTDYDRATDFEALGGKLIELPASDWRAVVTAG